MPHSRPEGKPKHVIVGAGEVGQALALLLPGAVIRDIEPVDVVADYLHIAYPWSDQFEASVLADVQRHQPDHVLVHSTVPVGTCDPHGWVHTPIRGRHPYLLDSLKAFPKFFGGTDSHIPGKAFEDRGVDCIYSDRAAETEAGKLWELAQYATQIMVEKAIWGYCQDRGLDAGVVYGMFAETYNEGYAKLGNERFVRPVLTHVDGPIGGHCVMPGVGMLDDELAKLLIDWNGNAP